MNVAIIRADSLQARHTSIRKYNEQNNQNANERWGVVDKPTGHLE
jgi:hypothetical protein